jgi:hypothetical protein
MMRRWFEHGEPHGGRRVCLSQLANRILNKQTLRERGASLPKIRNLRLCQLFGQKNGRELRLLEDVMQGAGDGLKIMLKSAYLKRPAEYRLAFRELGLAIGLRAVPIIARAFQNERKA